MDAWRRQKGEIHHNELQRTRSYNRKPPLACWQPTVPAWEKKFCSSVGSVPWGRLLEAKRFLYLYDNVVQWNDSAVEEAFNNAKSRYWAAINGLPCDISLPGPDIYIDEVDWDSEVDPELILDLERELEELSEANRGENGVILCDSLFLNQTFSCTGWGDAEDEPKKNPENCDWNAGNHENSWEQVYVMNKEAPVDNEWENCWQKSSEWNTWENTYHEWNNNNYRESRNKDYGSGGNRGNCDGNRRRREGNGSHTSKLKTSRFQGNDSQVERGLRNGRWRKRGVVCA